MRESTIRRTTRETDIELTLSLDGKGRFTGTSGIGFFDHMLAAFAVHGGFDLALNMTGDLEVDCHHSVEDVGIVLGQALLKALGGRDGIARYGSFLVPMDEALAFCALDISGRPFLVFDCAYRNPSVGAFDCCMTGEFLPRLRAERRDHPAPARALRRKRPPQDRGPLQGGRARASHRGFPRGRRGALLQRGALI